MARPARADGGSFPCLIIVLVTFVHRGGVTVKPVGPQKLTLAEKLAKFDLSTHGGEAMAATPVGAEIHWGDESGLRSDDMRARSHPPNGWREQQAARLVDHLHRPPQGREALADLRRRAQRRHSD